MDQEQAAKIRRAWSESAIYWQKHIGTIREMFAPVTRAMIEEAQIAAGYAVLDVAGGAGEPSLAIAEKVVPGRVVCTDVAPGMVTAARLECQRRGLDNLYCVQCSAARLPFVSDSFDCVVSRFGVMFFADPLESATDMLRVARRGAALCFAVWGKPTSNPFFGLVTEILSHYIESPPEDPQAPGAFRFADSGALCTILERAGAMDVRERVLDFRIEAPLPTEGFWSLRHDLSDSLREKTAPLPADQLELLKNEVEKAAGPYLRAGRMSFPAQVLIVTGIRP